MTRQSTLKTACLSLLIGIFAVLVLGAVFATLNPDMEPGTVENTMMGSISHLTRFLSALPLVGPVFRTGMSMGLPPVLMLGVTGTIVAALWAHDQRETCQPE